MTFDVIASGYGLVEGPTVPPEGGLSFSDVLGGGVFHWSPTTGVTTVVPKRRGVGGLAVHADGGIVASGRDVVHVRDGDTRTVAHIKGVAGWNDLCTDSAGRVYAGALRFSVFDPEAAAVPGEVWRVDATGRLTAVLDGVVHANGIALSPDERWLYCSDTRAQCVHVLDLHDGTRATLDMAAHGRPDGMAIDEHGAIWLALVEGGLARFTPDGSLDRRIDVPSSFVTSACFDGRDLYVVTANHTGDPALRGCVLRTRVDVAGATVHPARV